MTRWKRELGRFLTDSVDGTEPNETWRARIDYRFGRVENNAAVGFQCLNEARWHRARYARFWFYAAMGHDGAEETARYALLAAKDAVQNARRSPPAPLP